MLWASALSAFSPATSVMSMTRPAVAISQCFGKSVVERQLTGVHVGLLATA